VDGDAHPVHRVDVAEQDQSQGRLSADPLRDVEHEVNRLRQALNYPPFSRLVNLRVDGPKATAVEKNIQLLAAGLRALQTRNPQIYDNVEVLGPAAAPIEKLRNRYRWQLLLRSKHSSRLLKLARAARDILPNSRAVRLHIDVDPYSML